MLPASNADSDRDELTSRELGNFMAFEVCIGHFPWYVDKLTSPGMWTNSHRSKNKFSLCVQSLAGRNLSKKSLTEASATPAYLVSKVLAYPYDGKWYRACLGGEPRPSWD